MKVLIVIAKGPHYSFLVTLHTEKLKREVRNLIGLRKNSLAMAAALSKGRFEREVACHEVRGLKADLLLSENNVNWDLTKEG